MQAQEILTEHCKDVTSVAISRNGTSKMGTLFSSILKKRCDCLMHEIAPIMADSLSVEGLDSLRNDKHARREAIANAIKADPDLLKRCIGIDKMKMPE